MDMIGLAGLIIAIIALIVSVWGIRDVRNQVRFLLTIERDRAYTKALNGILFDFVDEDAADHRLRWTDAHEFSMLEVALNPRRTLDSSQTLVINEALSTAEKLVMNGMAKWKRDMDADKAREVIREWQNAKNTAAMNSIFGERRNSLF